MAGNGRRRGRSEYGGASRNFYHISFASECQLCFETCQKPRRLPCEHEFCKECLADYFDKIPDEDLNTFFPCPSCNSVTAKPTIPKSKWTKAFKLDKWTMFYTGVTTDDPLDIHTTNPPSLHPEYKEVSRRATTHGKPSSRELSKRSAVHYTGVHETYPGFNTTLSTDEGNCVYWGGTILSTGHIVLADFYNSCVKVFTVYGNHVCHTKIAKRPFDLTEIHDNTLIVSHGAGDMAVTYLSYTDTNIRHTGTIPIDGHLYSVTRRGKHCLGLLETVDGTIQLARITAGGSVMLRDPGDLSVFLSSASHVLYSEKDNRYYFTEKRNLLCVDKAFNILFLKSYPYLDTNHYLLGSLTQDLNGTIFIASDMCVLRIDKDGDLQLSPVPTTIDPFNTMVTPDGTKLILVGRSNRVSIYMPPQG